MNLNEIYILICAFLSEILGTIGGFGSSAFFVPTASVFESLEIVLVLTSFLHVVGNLIKIYLFRKDFDFKKILSLAIPSIILTIIGATLVSYLPQGLLKLAIGYLLLLLVCLKYLFAQKMKHLSSLQVKIMIGTSGFLTGIFGTGGALRALALSSLNLSKNSFVITSASIDLLGDLGRLFIYLKNFSLSQEYWFYLPTLIAVSWLGSWLGKQILKRISEKKFKILVTVLIISVALFTIIQNS